MHLVQLFLPLADNVGDKIPRATFDAVRERLVVEFGGMTAYARAPAKGLWADEGDEVVVDELVVYEVIVADLDREWWSTYRSELEAMFAQQELLIRAQRVEQL